MHSELLNDSPNPPAVFLNPERRGKKYRERDIYINAKVKFMLQDRGAAGFRG